ncbi:hypothetical protein EHS25_007539 [Saitozyma podzolica]|uniref:Rab-GAP TBC domain-containing protein n=1 Tax=Saitozyma podzolica TaxID=1890683 RepID=A0A427YQ66_9TREE|nr:hypothetical protein EHS25_007539 [Saitozyma podzolica]
MSRPSPEPYTNTGDLGEHEDDVEVDLSSAPPSPFVGDAPAAPTVITAAASAHPPAPAPTSPLSPRRLTPSRPSSRPSSPRSTSPSPYNIPLPADSLNPSSQVSASASRNSLASPPRSPIRSPRSLSPHSIRSARSPPPPPIFLAKPSLPRGVSLFQDASGPDSSADQSQSTPFESIPITETPPPQSIGPSTPASPPTPRREKRSSWTNLGVSRNGDAHSQSHSQSHSNSHSRSSLSVNGESRRSSAAPEAHSDGQPSNGNGSDSAPRLHAPPAHPHPYPVPSPSSPEVGTKRLSIASTSSQPPVPPPHHLGALGVKGVSAFEKVLSHTRPSYLPPKDKVEDETHLHQWEEMMSHSRVAEKERKKSADAGKVEKEKRIAAATPRWDGLLSGQGGQRFSTENVMNDEGLRRMWFEGPPGYLRGKAWSLAIGNELAMSKDAYKFYVTRAKKAVDSGRFPQDTLDRMDKEMDETLPTLKLFGPSGPMREDLKEILCAWVVYRSDSALGYASYISHLAAMFLLVSPASQAFISLCNLLHRPCLRAFFTDTKDEIDAYYRVFENLQADTFPKIYANCKNLGLRLPESYFRSLLVEQVPFEACCRLWDQIVLEGDGYIFRAALAIFGFLEPRLHFPDKEEIESVLEGRNRATLAITEREKERAKLRGEAYSEALDGKLSVFGLNEHALFAWLEKDGWKESRFERLVTREMPD